MKSERRAEGMHWNKRLLYLLFSCYRVAITSKITNSYDLFILLPGAFIPVCNFLWSLVDEVGNTKKFSSPKLGVLRLMSVSRGLFMVTVKYTSDLLVLLSTASHT